MQSSPLWSYYTADGWKLGSFDSACLFLEDNMGRIQLGNKLCHPEKKKT
jgi:hypothetical protein